MGLRKLVLIGGGGHCKSVLDAALSMGCFDDIVITDPELPEGSTVLGCRVAGADSALKELYREGFKNAHISIGGIESSVQRRRLYDVARDIGYLFANIIDPSAIVAESTILGHGVFIGKNAIVNADATISDCAIINTACIIEHECRIGAFSHVAVGATICGGVSVDADSFIGANGTIIQGVKVGMNSVVGAGSTILSDVPDNTTAVGIWRHC